MIDYPDCFLSFLANEYFSYMRNNRLVVRKFVAEFREALSNPRKNVARITTLCDEFNKFRMTPLRGKLDKLDEESIDKLDGALLGRLKGFDLQTVLNHECYEHMRSLEEKPLEIKGGPVLIRGLVAA